MCLKPMENMTNNVTAVQSVYAQCATWISTAKTAATVLAFLICAGSKGETRRPHSDSTSGRPDAGRPCQLEARTRETSVTTRSWAQEYVGSDLAKELVGQHPSASKPRIGVIDDNFLLGAIAGPFSPSFSMEETVSLQDRLSSRSSTTHGTSVANLILGPMGSAANASFVDLVKADPQENYLQGAVDRMLKARPQLVNMSMMLGRVRHGDENTEANRTFLANVNKLANSTIVVVAAGNNYPQELDPVEKQAPVILVSALNEWGSPASYSQGEGQTTISVPSDGVMTFSGVPTNHFDGTSAAAPIATGALANALSFLPDLDLDEAKLLLKNTAVSRGTGTGMLNAFKLSLVAKNLRGMDKNQRRLALENPSTFDFNTLAQRELIAAKEELDLAISGNDCSKYRTAIKGIRKAFLMARSYPPSDTFLSSAELLSTEYSLSGFRSNANFYASFLPARQKAVVESALRSDDYSDRVEAIRFLRYLEPTTALGILDKFADANTVKHPAEQSALLTEALAIGRSALPFAKSFATSLLKSGGSLPMGLYQHGDDTAFELATHLLSDPTTAIGGMMGLNAFGKRGETLLETTYQNSTNSRLKMQALASAGWAAPLGWDLIKKGTSETDPELRGTAYFMARRYGTTAVPLVKQGIAEKDLGVRAQVFYLIYSLDKQGVDLSDVPGIREFLVETQGTPGIPVNEDHRRELVEKYSN